MTLLTSAFRPATTSLADFEPTGAAASDSATLGVQPPATPTAPLSDANVFMPSVSDIGFGREVFVATLGECPQEERQVGRPLGEPAHEVAVPLRAERHVART